MLVLFVGGGNDRKMKIAAPVVVGWGIFDFSSETAKWK